MSDCLPTYPKDSDPTPSLPPKLIHRYVGNIFALLPSFLLVDFAAPPLPLIPSPLPFLPLWMILGRFGFERVCFCLYSRLHRVVFRGSASHLVKRCAGVVAAVSVVLKEFKVVLIWARTGGGAVRYFNVRRGWTRRCEEVGGGVCANRPRQRHQLYASRPDGNQHLVSSLAMLDSFCSSPTRA